MKIKQMDQASINGMIFSKELKRSINAEKGGINGHYWYYGTPCSSWLYNVLGWIALVCFQLLNKFGFITNLTSDRDLGRGIKANPTLPWKLAPFFVIVSFYYQYLLSGLCP